MRQGSRVAGVGILTGWGAGIAALPADARAAAGGRAVVTLGRPELDGDRFRRATRECLLGVEAVNAMLRDSGIDREAIRGDRTALVFVTAGAYGPSNAEFIRAGRVSPAAGSEGASQERRGSSGTLHFPYTAPSAVSGEVAIEFGLTGAYVILIGGATATIDALWQATRLLAAARCDQALVLAIETFAECEALWRRARWTLPAPLVESAACALLVADDLPASYRAAASGAGVLQATVETRAGRTLAVAPLLALGLAREAGSSVARVGGTWRGRTAAIELAIAGRAARV
jgi:Beta-ketoacyl synthase, N-terminal domain